MGLAALIVLAILAVIAACVGYALHRRRRKPVSGWGSDTRAGDKNASDADLSSLAYSSELLASPSDDSATDMLSDTGESRSRVLGEASSDGAWGRRGRSKSGRVDGDESND